MFIIFPCLVCCLFNSRFLKVVCSEAPSSVIPLIKKQVVSLFFEQISFSYGTLLFIVICELDFYRFRCGITHRSDHLESTRAIGHLHDGIILLLRPESFSFFRSSLNLVMPERFKKTTALSCTQKQNPKGFWS